MHRMLELAVELAQGHSYDTNLSYKLCAIIFKGSSIISVGYNKTAKNRYVEYLSKYDPSSRPFINQHAEVNAILKARAKTDLTGCKIAVARIKPSGVVGMARPCIICSTALASYGIKRALYTIDDDSYGVLNIKADTDAVVNLTALREFV